MKTKSLALLLVLMLAARAQVRNVTQPSAAPEKKGNCTCCGKKDAANAKDGQSCARRGTQSADGTQIATCCDDTKEKSCCGKDAKCPQDDKAACCSDCNKQSKDKVASFCCRSVCGKECGHNCRSGRSDKASTSCRGRIMRS